MDSLYIAWRYLLYHRSRTLILIACITLIAFLPLALELLLHESERQLMDRARSTPLLLGADGSAFDLVMNSLYFSDELPALMKSSAVDQLDSSGLATTVPLYVRFKARGFPVVGTNLDYFELRDLKLVSGQPFLVLGECVLGAEVAASLQLAPGDTLVSTPEILFDLAGVYPLRMRVTGVLEPAQSADDRAVFVDVHTAWAIQGLVHGHQGLDGNSDGSIVLEKSADTIVANAAVMQYREINADNVGSFHFHGDAGDYPLSAAIVVPPDQKSSALLRGRYLDVSVDEQLVEPVAVVGLLMQTIFRIRNLLDSALALVSVAALLALVLVFSLSLRLREREIDTLYRLGGSRATVVRLLAAETGLIMIASGLLCSMLLLLVAHYDRLIVRQLLF